VAQGKYGSPSWWFLVAGFNMLANKLQDLRYKVTSLLEQTDGGGDSWQEHTPTGVAMLEVSQDGAYFDTTAGNVHDAMSAQPGGLGPQSAARVATLGYEGMAIGSRFIGVQGAYNHEYEVLGSVGKLQRANVGYKVSGQIDEGVILHTTTAPETADANTEASSVDNTTVPQRAIPITSSSVADLITCPVPHGLTVGDTVLISGHAGSTPSINSEQTVATVPSTTTFTVATDITVGGTGGSFVRGETNQGGVAYLEWTNLTLGGHSGALVTIRHSVNNSTFVDLVAMTSATAARGAERKTVAGEVRRYTAQAVDFQGAGSPSMTYLAGVARN